MLSFLENMSTLQQSFWVLAVVVSLIFFVQTLLTVMGGDAGDGLDFDIDADADFDSVDSPFSLFSFRNLINFLLGFSWTGVAFFNEVENKTLLIFIAFAVGVIFLIAFFFIIQQILKLSEDNTFNIENLKGKTGEVYLNIPANASGKGKVLISLKGSTHELSAISKGGAIASASIVKVVDIEDKILVVEKI